LNNQDSLAFLGGAPSTIDFREETIRNIKLIIRVRWFISPGVLLILLLASSTGLSRQEFFSSDQLIVNGTNTLIILGFNLAYRLLVRRIENVRPLVYFQLFIDALHFTLTIYKTGGVTSPLTFLYFGVIFAAALLASGAASFITAGISTLLFSLIIILERYSILPHQDYFLPLSGLHTAFSYQLLSWLFVIFSFFMMAFLASFLTWEIRRKQIRLKGANTTLNKKIQTLLLLYRTSKAMNTFERVDKIADFILGELLEFLNLDRALLYLNVNDSYLHLFQVKKRNRQFPEKSLSQSASTTEAETAGLKVDIPLEEGAGLTALCALKQKPFNIHNPEESELINRELARKIGMNPFALAPLVVRSKLVGVIGIDRSYKNGWITEDEFQILMVFANQAAISLQGLCAERELSIRKK